MCMVRPWLEHLLLTFTMGLLLAKMWCTWRQFALDPELQRVEIACRRLFGHVAGVLSRVNLQREPALRIPVRP
jgi:hypothetical protein